MDDVTSHVHARANRAHARGVRGDVELLVQTNCRRVLKAFYGPGVRTLRKVGVAGFARQMIDVDTLIAQTNGGDAVRWRRWNVDEPPRSPITLPLSDTISPLRGVRTTISLLDITDPGFSIRNGYLVDPERRIVYEKKVIASFNSLRVALTPLERPRHLRGVVAWLWNSNNYGHWLLLALPLIHYYRSVLGGDPDYYYVGSHIRSYQAESLEMIGIPRERVIDHAVRADRTLVAIPDRTEDYDSDFLLFADRNLRPSAGPTNFSEGRRLFVSRKGAAHRRLVNEDECATALMESFGVELVSTEGMSLHDEIDLFRSASLVVGAHGAGLTNLIFTPSGSRVIELASGTYWDSLFAQIAAVKRQPYALVRGRSRRLRMGVPPAWHDFEVNVASLVKVVGAALAAPVRAR